MIESSEIVRTARQWIGVPYLHQGRSRSGVDCIGLIICVVEALKLLPRNVAPRNYGPMPARGLLEAGFAEYCTQIDEPRAGCVVLMKWTNAQHISHCAILTGENMVHSYKKVGKVVEHGFRAAWPERAAAFFALPGVRYE